MEIPVSVADFQQVFLKISRRFVAPCWTSIWASTIALLLYILPAPRNSG